MRPVLTSLFLLLIVFGHARAQASIEWEQAYADAIGAAENVTVVNLSTLSPPTAYPLLLMPDSIRVEGELDEIGRTILDFRARHPAVAAGEHFQLVNHAYTFQRSLTAHGRRDVIVVVLGAEGRTTVNVSRAFSDDTLLRDVMSGKTVFVSFGLASFEAHPSGIILIEEAPAEGID